MSQKWVSDWFDKSYNQYLRQTTKLFKSENIISNQSLFQNYHSLPSDTTLPNIAIVKLNGGLGTSMGCSGPKSLIKCSPDGKTFFDCIIKQFNENNMAKKLILLNSYNTTNETTNFISNHYPNLQWTNVIQHPFKKINLKTNKPFTESGSEWMNPPGHGSIYFDLYHSGILDECLEEKIDYLFISNADNLAATIDKKIASYVAKNNISFLIELTEKTSADQKGGTIINYNGQLMLWEIAQITHEQKSLFESQPVFNTNNIWIHIPTLIQKIKKNALYLDLILNKKTKDNLSYIQLEYAMGSAIQSFQDAQALIVPRSRFFPIKKTSDLFLLKSNLTTINHNGHLTWSINHQPFVSFGPPFDTIDGFLNHIKVMPSINKLNHFEVSGSVYFNEPIELIGTIKLHEKSGIPFQVPKTDYLENIQLNNDNQLSKL